MVKIYFDNRVLLLANREQDSTVSLEGHETTLTKESHFSVAALLSDEAIYPLGHLYWTNDVNALLDQVKLQVPPVPAGGGFIYAPDEKVLMIFRRGKWDLPKGKLDEDESLAECALREVEEETGLSAVSLGEHLTTTYHMYKERKQWLLKESHWYMMQAAANQILTPQAEEDIEECRWVPLSELPTYYANAQPSIIDVLKEGLNRLQTTRQHQK